MKNKILILLTLFLLSISTANANIIFPHLMLINLYSVFLFAILIISVETFYYKKSYNYISVWFWLISTVIANTASSFAGIFYGALSFGGLGYSSNILLILANFIICCILSWLIEYIILLPITKIFKKQAEKLLKNVFFANLYSYIMIFILYSIIFYVPYTHEKFFYGFSM